MEVAWSRLWSDPIALGDPSDQSQLRSMWLWSDYPAFKVASDQTQLRSKSPLIRHNCARSRLWSDQLRSKSPLIRPNCARSRLWSDPSAVEVASDQTQVRSKRFMIRPNCARIRLWLDPIALEVGSDQTQVRSNPPMIRLFRPKWPLIRPSPDHDQTVVRSIFWKKLVILVWERTGVHSTGSDQKSIWVWTSTWETRNVYYNYSNINCDIETGYCFSTPQLKPPYIEHLTITVKIMM